ncbi:DNA replication/repair protein RecF [Porphyromonas circumdentaria]|uniref:DNA replication and repair protein RecF n=1 Tax=Porphyromonas circumdentaria TaxID=29524 RepID=A0A1T4PFJ1_9PORP|nr:DNA replication and repair protein RecF [Porphyromonas circumdentaria]MBB6275714.1 DNA replication and repair protein RecF [Porphyromonas circumdentaria]MDO4722709.1 DNA replication and repair protein RecF [Porphyromonas circumdentaria]SJZ90330.1 DNA replication and repair protein RecF [Porphyromonas circumdentaria]
MILSHIDLIAFKSISAASCDLAPKLNCLLGGNGMGKTNFLDAIHYLSMTRSHLNTIDRMAVQHGAAESIISGCYLNLQDQTEDTITLRIRPESPKALSRNGRLYKRLSEHIGRYPLVTISPQDYRLIRGSSEERRHFLDRMIAQQNPTYLNNLIRYDHLVNQRNNLLRGEQVDDMLFGVVEEQMALIGRSIAQERASFISSFTPIFNQFYQTISQEGEQVSLHYKTKTAPTVEEYLSALRQNRPIERMAGHSMYGVHKDDLDMFIDEYLIRKIGSEGQNKTYLTALKFSEYQIVAEKLKCRPILLLDDLFDKLDADRVERIIEIVASSLFGQIFITDTNRKYLDAIIHAQGEEYHLFKVDRGEITQLPN